MDAKTTFLGIALVMAALASVPASAEDVAIRHYGDSEPVKPGEVQFRDIAIPEPSPYVATCPLAIAFAPRFEFPDESWDVVMLRLDILVGRHRNFHGLDIGGLGNFTVGEMGGIGVAGLFNDCGSSKAAILVAGAVNHSSWNFSGGQVSGLFSWTEGLHSGLQVAPVNKAGRLDGVQIGALNMAGPGTGLQIGVINVAERLSGFQIGAININRDSTMPFMPVINFAF
jgi:hypothetical protein